MVAGINGRPGVDQSPCGFDVVRVSGNMQRGALPGPRNRFQVQNVSADFHKTRKALVTVVKDCSVQSFVLGEWRRSIHIQVVNVIDVDDLVKQNESYQFFNVHVREEVGRS